MIYPGADGDFTLYYDDGDDKNYDENNMWVRFQTTRQENTCLVSINPAEGNFIPASRNITLKFVASDVPEHVYCNDKEIEWEYDGENFTLVVALPEGDWKDKTDIRVEYQKNSTFNLTDGTLGNYHRAVKAIAEQVSTSSANISTTSTPRWNNKKAWTRISKHGSRDKWGNNQTRWYTVATRLTL